MAFSGGISFYESTSVYYSEEHYTTNNYSSIQGAYRTEGRDKMETFDNKTTWGVSMFLPIGIDLALGTQSRFWKRLHVFAEIRPELNFNRVPELKRNFNNRSFVSGLGLRYSWF